MHHSNDALESIVENNEVDYPTIDTNKIEKQWAKDFLEKTSCEREILLDELHGVSSRAIPESEEMIDSALSDFQDTIDNFMPADEKRGYELACSINSSYVHSRLFRLKFLRAELFHIANAALRYLRNLNYLLDTFGEYALIRQLHVTDLSHEEMKFLKKGYMQLLPFRDRAGRMVLANLGSYGGFDFSLRTKLRVATYITFATLSEDVSSQKKGAISLGLLSTEAIDSVQLTKLSEIKRFNGAMPIRFSGYHNCYPDQIRFRILKAMLLTGIQGDLRHLTRVHIGTQMECDYILRSFGIPTEFIPRSFTGTIKDNYLKIWLKTRIAIEDYQKAQSCGDYRYYYRHQNQFDPFPGIECPENNCFIVRKHGVAWNHPGNVEMRLFLEEKEEERGKKRLEEDYINSVVEEMNARNIEILIFDEGNGWYTSVTKKEVMRKHVWRAMRDHRKRKSARREHRMQQENIEEVPAPANACSESCFSSLKSKCKFT